MRFHAAICTVFTVLVASPALGNFHILQGTFVLQTPGEPITTQDVYYAPSNKYNCGWLGSIGKDRTHNIHSPTIQYPSDVTFTAPNPICGVENMTFHYREGNGFTLTDDNGDAGECIPNEDTSTLGTFRCGNYVNDVEFWWEMYVCYSYACQDGTDGS